LTDAVALFLHLFVIAQKQQGAWSWQWNAGGECSDDASQQGDGMRHINGMQNEGQGLIDVSIG
jgi:hypothetical protein